MYKVDTDTSDPIQIFLGIPYIGEMDFIEYKLQKLTGNTQLLVQYSLVSIHSMLACAHG